MGPVIVLGDFNFTPKTLFYSPIFGEGIANAKDLLIWMDVGEHREILVQELWGGLRRPTIPEPKIQIEVLESQKQKEKRNCR